MLTRTLAALLCSLLSSCVSLTADPRLLLPQADGAVLARTLSCDPAALASRRAYAAGAAEALDPESIRVLTWNIHKEEDPGWEADLRRFVNDNDLVLLQEAVLREPLRHIIEDSGLRWVMASSFAYRDDDIGVLTAARAAARAQCTQRVVEPLIRLPKSALVNWFGIKGSAATLAVVNVHAINFSLSLDAYTQQFTALAEALGAHAGPIIFAGDLNTWTDARAGVVTDMARRLGLTAVVFNEDKRSLFLGKQLDHLFVRGLEVIEAAAIPVRSSDHNPVAATLRVRQDAR